MKDHNDFFDEMIDVDDESDGESAEFLEEEDDYDLSDEEDEEDEDDGSTVVRTALLQKNDMLALLSLKAAPDGGQLVRYDPRQSLPSMRRYDSEEEARRWYARSLATSRKNGWAVVYDGEPLVG
ncbi:MAG: hypothetical protein ACJ754_28080 [Pyrinomonadaceae bacterium]|jgi:hypothetical protein